jgi:hypothetical protein
LFFVDTILLAGVRLSNDLLCASAPEPFLELIEALYYEQ